MPSRHQIRFVAFLVESKNLQMTIQFSVEGVVGSKDHYFSDEKFVKMQAKQHLTSEITMNEFYSLTKNTFIMGLLEN